MAKIIILSGAGISSESGISTFRDEDGLWENHKIEDICVSGCLDFNRDNTIKFYDMLRVNLEDDIFKFEIIISGLPTAKINK